MDSRSSVGATSGATARARMSCPHAPDGFNCPDQQAKREGLSSLRRAGLISGSSAFRWSLVAAEIPSRREGKALSLGVYPDVSLRTAREKRDEARSLLAGAGIDPSAHRQTQKLAAANTFEQVAREWHAKQKSAWVSNHVDKVLSNRSCASGLTNQDDRSSLEQLTAWTGDAHQVLVF